MEQKNNPIERDGFNESFQNIQKFRELFALLQTDKPGKQYQNAYQEAAHLAKDFVETKNKTAWNPTGFEIHIKEKYPDISQDFIDALKRCIENYNPPVNIPEKPLWE